MRKHDISSPAKGDSEARLTLARVAELEGKAVVTQARLDDLEKLGVEQDPLLAFNNPKTPGLEPVSHVNGA